MTHTRATVMSHWVGRIYCVSDMNVVYVVNVVKR